MVMLLPGILGIPGALGGPEGGGGPGGGGIPDPDLIMGGAGGGGGGGGAVLSGGGGGGGGGGGAGAIEGGLDPKLEGIEAVDETMEDEPEVNLIFSASNSLILSSRYDLKTNLNIVLKVYFHLLYFRVIT